MALSYTGNVVWFGTTLALLTISSSGRKQDRAQRELSTACLSLAWPLPEFRSAADALATQRAGYQLPGFHRVWAKHSTLLQMMLYEYLLGQVLAQLD